MISEQRKIDLVTELEYTVNRYIDKQWLVDTWSSWICETTEEQEYLNSLNYNFVAEAEQ